jgi:hypothetical protein
VNTPTPTTRTRKEAMTVDIYPDRKLALAIAAGFLVIIAGLILLAVL